MALFAPLAMKAADPAAGTNGKLPLSLKRALEIAIAPHGNPNIQLAAEAYGQAQSRSAEERAGLLPNLEGSAGETSVIRSLGSLGLNSVVLPFGLKLPTIVGPYDIVDIRASGIETLSFSSIRRYQASQAEVRVAAAERDNAANSVAGRVAKIYMEALRAQADYEAASADVNLAEAVLKQAETQKAAGTGTGIEVTRAKAQLSNERQRELVVQNQQHKARLELLHAMGMPLDRDIELTSRLDYVPVTTIPLADMLDRALKTRADFKAQVQREGTARLMASSAKWDRLPSVSAYGDYGTTGQGLGTSTLPTREFGAVLKLSVFDGGRRDARRAEAASQFRSEALRTKDARQQIELELREATDSLHSAEEQMRVAEEGLALADSELTQARRRYAAGATNSLEVTDAQTRMERARGNRNAGLFNYNLARIDLGQAMGSVQDMIQ